MTMCNESSCPMERIVRPSTASSTSRTVAVVAVSRSLRALGSASTVQREARAPEKRLRPLLQEHEPLGAAGAVLVLHAAPAAVPVRPPDPLEVVPLQHDQADAPNEDLRLAHVRHSTGVGWGVSMGRPAHSPSR